MVGSAACFQECSDWDCGDRCLDEGISFLCCLNWVVLESPGLENLELQVKSQVFHVLKSNTVNFCLKAYLCLSCLFYETTVTYLLL